MAIDYMKVVRNKFESIGPRNPLKKLSDQDKGVLLAFLITYMGAPATDEFSNHLEKAAGIAAEAGALAKRIQSEVLGGPIAKALAPLLDGFQDLPAHLVVFSKIGTLVHKFTGKPGHKGTMAKNEYLIMASEFVHLKTGKHNDEHLAELLQTVDFVSGAEGETRETSGDSIRKKREYLKRTYPLKYAHTIKRVRRSSSPHGKENLAV